MIEYQNMKAAIRASKNDTKKTCQDTLQMTKIVDVLKQTLNPTLLKVHVPRLPSAFQLHLHDSPHVFIGCVFFSFLFILTVRNRKIYYRRKLRQIIAQMQKSASVRN